MKPLTPLVPRGEDMKNSSHFLREIRKKMNSNRQKLSREIYNLDSRNIKQFTKEWQSMRKKFKDTGKVGGYAPHRQINLKKSYEENQLLQFEFNNRFSLKEEESDNQYQASYVQNRCDLSIHSISTKQNQSFHRKINKMNSFKINYIKCSQQAIINRQKSISATKDIKFELRRRIATQFCFSADSKRTESRGEKDLKISKGSPQFMSQDCIIEINRSNMDKFIKNLHLIQWSCRFLKGKQYRVEQTSQYQEHMKHFIYDPDSPIQQNAINYMICRRYCLLSYHLEDIYEVRSRQLRQQCDSRQKEKLADASEYPLLSELSRYNILALMQKNIKKSKISQNMKVQRQNQQSEIHFALPFTQFISYRQTKISIYRLLAMNTKATFKIAFSIFDKNRNGKIDQNDLLQLISLSRKISLLENDISILSQAMIITKQTKKSIFESKGVQSNIREKSSTLGHQEQLNFRIEQEQIDLEEGEQDPKNTGIQNNFSVNRLYTFLKKQQKITKKQSKQNKSQSIQELNFFKFCEAYSSQRPYVIYDLFKFVFGAQIRDYKPEIQYLIKDKMMIAKMKDEYKNTKIKDDETLQQKWNIKLKDSNQIIEKYVNDRLKY